MPGSKIKVNIEALVRAYVNLRDQLKELSRKAKLEQEPLVAAMTQLEAELLARLNASDAESIKTAAGTVYKEKEEYIKVGDWDVFFAWALRTQNHHFFVRNVARDPVKEYIERCGEPPEGVQYDSAYVVRVRRPK